MTLRLGEILVEKGLLTRQQLDAAVKEQQKTQEMLGQALVRMGFITEKKMLQTLAEQQGIEFVELANMIIPENVIKSISPKFAWHYKIMPVSIEGNLLTVAISNPFEMWAIDDLETNFGYRVVNVLATTSDIMEAIKKYYGVGAETVERILTERTGKGEEDKGAGKEKVEDLSKMAEAASVIKLVNQILQQAINDRATDIHIEHFRDDLFLRYRIDGILYDAQAGENIKYLYPAIVSRIKVMSSLDIVERRLPQDGRAKVRIGKDEYDLRISIIPTLYGENIVIRILPTTMLFNISDLGMSEKDAKIMQGLLELPHGIIFVTGPTGSGKTTTLYTCLSRLNSRERKIVTIEDPIEYELRGVSQTQINPKIGLTFERMLRSMLRHDPDVMMVGEVRDYETAEITIQTALTGHLVFSTLHTNDAATGATRLLDIGVEPFLVASSVEAFIAQRLVRVICGKCKEKAEIPPDVLRVMEVSDTNLKGRGSGHIYRGKGCKACNNTGYTGRTGIYEVLLVNEEIRKLILQRTTSEVIKKKAVELGMHTLRQDGWDKVLQGITTPEEVIRVTQMEG